MQHYFLQAPGIGARRERPQLLFILILVSSVVLSAGDNLLPTGIMEVNYPYLVSELLEAECGIVGSHLTIVADETATGGAYVTTTTAVFPDEQPTGPDDYIRFTIPERGSYTINFRARSPESGALELLTRVNDGQWRSYVGNCDNCPPANEAGWIWGPADYNIYGQTTFNFSRTTGPQTLDIAFPVSGLQFDQIYLEKIEAFRDEFARPFDPGFYPLAGDNCSDIPNLPPVAVLPGQEGYPGSYVLDGTASYDPDGIIVKYAYPPGAEIFDYFGRYADIYLPQPGDQEVFITVTDYHGLSTTATTLFRVVEKTPPSTRTTFRLQGECAATGGYWRTTPGAGYSNGSIAQGGNASSETAVPADLPQNQLRFTVPNVAAADAGRYYLAGSFVSQFAEDNCVWININGQGWNKWDILFPYRSFYNGPSFNLVAGDNTVALAYCSSELGVDQLILSPDTGFPDILDPERYKSGGKIVNVPCPSTDLTDQFWLEAECAAVGGKWSLRSDPAASADRYVVVVSGNTLTAPPADLPENYVRFTTSNAKAGNYYLQARINAPTVQDDSYYVRVNGGSWYAWKSAIQVRKGFAWNLLPGRGLTLAEGVNTIDFAYREDGTQLDKIYLSPSSALITGQGQVDAGCTLQEPTSYAAYFEVECAANGTAYGSTWKLVEDPAASNGAYLVVPKANSLATPPADVAANQIQLEFGIVSALAGSTFYLYARIDAPTPDDDSFWVRWNGGPWYAWKSGIRIGEGFAWNRLPIPLTDVRSGKNLLEFAYRESGAKLDAVYLTSLDKLPDLPVNQGRDCSGMPSQNLAYEAECATANSQWKTFASTQASGGSYAKFVGDRQLQEPVANDPARELVVPFSTSVAGNYHVFMRMDAPDAGRNSVWVRVDDGPWIKMWKEIGGMELLTQGLEWRKVNNDGADIAFSLAAGSHVLRIANREPGTKIDKVVVSPTATLPTGYGPTAPVCTPTAAMAVAGTPVIPKPVERITEDETLSLYPNPVAGELTVELINAYAGRISFQVYDAQGRRVLEAHYDKAEGAFKEGLDVGQLASGVYRLQVIWGGKPLVKTFLRQ